MSVRLKLGLAGGWILAGRMLAPLTRITEATRKAASGSLSHRIVLPGRGDEFRDLADAFDAMLARLEAHVAEQQRFAANASHELRTPLAITQALLEVARSDPNHDREKLGERLRAVNTRAIDLTEALLLLSRADQHSFTREWVDLSLLAEEAAETLLPFAEKRGVTIACSSDITHVFGSRALLLQLITNLLHNAIVHNISTRGTVQVNASSGSGSVLLTVVNTGAELAPGLVSTPAARRRSAAVLRTCLARMRPASGTQAAGSPAVARASSLSFMPASQGHVTYRWRIGKPIRADNTAPA